MHNSRGKKYKFVVWGIGAIYNRLKNTLSYYELTNQMEVVGLVARDIPNAKTLDGVPLHKSARIKELKYDYILILSDDWFKEIVIDAMKYGIKREKLIHYKILQIPGMVLEEYLSLHKSCPTIISNNCWAGIIYNTLGLECCSPTKNLFIKDGDYIKFISDLEKYMAEVPIYSHNEVDVHSNREYPVLMLGDIEVHCNHTENPEQAIRDWKRRAEKVNFKHIFIEMYTERLEVAEAFRNVACDYKRVCFVPWETEEDCFMYLEKLPGQKEFWETVNGCASINGIQLNIIKLLNGRNDSNRLRSFR